MHRHALALLCMLIALALAAWPPTPANAADNPNLLKGASFESGMLEPAWTVDFTKEANRKATIVRLPEDASTLAGLRAVRIETQAGAKGYAILKQRVTFKKPYPDTVYATGLVKSDVDHFTKLYAWGLPAGGGKSVHLVNGTNYKATDGVRREQVTWKTGGVKMRGMVFMVIFSGAGWAEWDDLGLYLKQPPAHPLERPVAGYQVPKLPGPPTTRADWARAQPMDHFTLLGGTQPAAARTMVLAGWSGSNLHLRIECDEPLLAPVLNMNHLFKASPHPRDDGKVFSDDSVEIFFDPEQHGASFYQFCTNAAGARWDRKYGDTDWNGSWTSTGGVDDDSWWVELTVPLANLGLRGRVGEAFGFNVARNRRMEPEMSSLAPLLQSFHEPQRFATITLAAPGLVARIVPADQPAPGYAVTVFNPTKEPASAQAGYVRETEGEKPVIFAMPATTLAPGGRKVLNVSLTSLPPAGKAGRVRAFVQVRDSSRYPAMTPWRDTGTDGAAAELVIETTAPVTAWAGQAAVPLKEGENGLLRGTVLLRRGITPIGIELRGSGRFRAVLTEDDSSLRMVTSSAWKMTTGTRPDRWLDATMIPDGEAWKSADTAGESDNEGPLRGAEWLTGKAGTSVLRHVAFGRTGCAPEPDEGQPRLIFERFGQIARVYTFNAGGRPLPGYKLMVETGPGLRMLDPTGRLNWKIRNFVPTSREETALSDGFTRHTFSFAGPLPPARNLANAQERSNYVGLPFFVLPTGDGEPVMRVHCSWAGGFGVEAPRRIAFTKATFHQGGTMDGIDVQLWINAYRHFAPSSWPHMLDLLEATGVRTLLYNDIGGDPYGRDRALLFYDMARKRGFRVGGVIHWPDRQREWLKGHPEDEAVYAPEYDKKRASWTRGLYVPQTLLLDPDHPVHTQWQERLRNDLQLMPFDELQWDHEVAPLARSYDERSLEAFRAFADIPGNVKLDAEIIAQQYRERWVDFRCDQYARQADLMRKVTRSVYPDAPFGVYSGYYQRSGRRYSCDWVVMMPVVDVALSGYLGEWDGAAAATARLARSQGKLFKGAVGFYTIGHKARLGGVGAARVLTEGGHGILLYAASNLHFTVTACDSVARATAMFPVLAPFVKDYAPKNKLLQASLPSAVLQDGDRYLIALYNRTAKAATTSLAWKGKDIVRVTRPPGGAESAGLPGKLTVPAYSVAWMLVETARE